MVALIIIIGQDKGHFPLVHGLSSVCLCPTELREEEEEEEEANRVPSITCH